jgi:beta-glucanase (GH16 family)
LPVVLTAAIALGSTPAIGETVPLQRAPDGRALELAFSDDFKSFRQYGLQGGIWRTTFGDGTQLGLDRRSLPTNGEFELYVDPLLMDADGNLGLNPFRVVDGHLDIVATHTPAALLPRLDHYHYISGMISSQPSFAQTYGYFEMRAKIPGGPGLWPAFWLLPADQTWPPEIDVMESVGDASYVYSTVHSTLRPAVEIEGRVTPDAYHTYAVSWDSRRVFFYVDGKEMGRQATPPDLHKPMYMIANLAVGGDWPGPPNSATVFPATLSIQYIRAYRFING